MSGNPAATPAPSYNSLINGGLTITSTSTPALNGTYSCDPTHMQAMLLQADAILLSGATPAFADGSQALNWPDIRNMGHAFTPAQFHELVVATANFVVQCLQFGVGLTANPPATTATIA